MLFHEANRLAGQLIDLLNSPLLSLCVVESCDIRSIERLLLCPLLLVGGVRLIPNPTNKTSALGPWGLLFSI